MAGIYLDARLPLASVTGDDLARLLGSVLTYADESFNSILKLGFESSIRKEWKWRISRGESTHDLEAFRGWLETGDAVSPTERDRDHRSRPRPGLSRCQQLPAAAAQLAL